MISRELLKKIRPIELRTNREVGRVTPCAPSVGQRHAPAGKGLPALPEAGRPAHPVAGISQVGGGVSPSPWGEGRDEGGRDFNFSPANGHFRPAERVNAQKAADFNVLSRFFAARPGISTPETASSNHGMDGYNSGFDPNNRGNAWKNSGNASENGGGRSGIWGRCLGKWGEGSEKWGGRFGKRGEDLGKWGEPSGKRGEASGNGGRPRGKGGNVPVNGGRASEIGGKAPGNGGDASDTGGVPISFGGCPQMFGQPTLFA